MSHRAHGALAGLALAVALGAATASASDEDERLVMRATASGETVRAVVGSASLADGEGRMVMHDVRPPLPDSRPLRVRRGRSLRLRFRADVTQVLVSQADRHDRRIGRRRPATGRDRAWRWTVSRLRRATRSLGFSVRFADRSTVFFKVNVRRAG